MGKKVLELELHAFVGLCIVSAEEDIVPRPKDSSSLVLLHIFYAFSLLKIQN